jgi:hypothetical protein
VESALEAGDLEPEKLPETRERLVLEHPEADANVIVFAVAEVQNERLAARLIQRTGTL